MLCPFIKEDLFVGQRSEVITLVKLKGAHIYHSAIGLEFLDHVTRADIPDMSLKKRKKKYS